MPYTLFIGGARCGKSSLAVRRARTWSLPPDAPTLSVAQAPKVVFVVTGVAGDDEMHDRIARHQRERDPAWITVEAPYDLVGGVRTALGHGPSTMVVIDCLSFWVANRLMRSGGEHVEAWVTAEGDLAQELDEVVRLLTEHPVPSVVVTNEVGSGLVPDTALGRQFRDSLGRMNALVSSGAASAYLVVAGRTLELGRP